MKQDRQTILETDMKQISKPIAVMTLSALLLSSAGAALAFGGSKGHHGNCDRDNRQAPMAALTRIDNLSEEQKDELKQIRKEARNAMRELRDQTQDNRTDLHDAMNDNADLKTIRRLAEEQGDQVAQKIVLRAQMRDKINAVLTEKQRQQLDNLRQPGGDFGYRKNRK